MEGTVYCGRTHAIRIAAKGRGEHGLVVPRVRHLPGYRVVSDHASRYLLLCEAMESIKEQGAFTAFERLFKERGLPQAIRSDNGVPFASPNGLFNLSRLAVWWLRLGITIERIQPGHPQQNGRHERLHRTLKIEATRPAGSNFLQQQAKFDVFVREFNYERPHEGLEMKCPADIYKPSTRPYRGIGELSYPFPRSDSSGYLLRKDLHFQKENKSQHFSGGSSRRH